MGNKNSLHDGGGGGGGSDGGGGQATGTREEHEAKIRSQNMAEQRRREHAQRNQRAIAEARRNDPHNTAKREHMARLAEERARKSKPNKQRAADIKRERWERYKSIDNPTEIVNEYESGQRDRRIKVGQTHQISDHAAAEALSVPASSGSHSGRAGVQGSAAVLKCPICGETFLSEASVNKHLDTTHSEFGISSDEHARQRRLKAAQKRMNNSGMKKSMRQRKDDNWRRYQSIGVNKKVRENSGARDSPRIEQEQSDATYSVEELDALELAVASFKGGDQPSAEAVAASRKMIMTILTKLFKSLQDTGGDEQKQQQDQASDRFRKIKLSNPKVQQKIVQVPHAIDVLKATGFYILSLPTADADIEDYLFFKRGLPSLRLLSTLRRLQS